MKRLTIEQKRVVARSLGSPDRPLNRIVDLTKPNGSPDYDSESLRRRSSETARARGEHYSKVARKMSSHS